MINDFKESIKVKNYTLNDTEKEFLFRDFVNSQKSHFESYMNFINSGLCVLKHYGIVSDFTRFLARIKSVESSIKNDKSKALNDVFGIEVDTATPGEAAFVVMLINSTLKCTKEAVKNKENKYVAHHYSGYPKAGNITEKFEEILDTTYNPTKLFQAYMAKIPKNIKEEMSKEEIGRQKEYFDNFSNDLNNYITIIKKTIYGEKLRNLKKDLKRVEQEYHKEEKLKTTGTENYFQPIIECQLKTIQTAIEANIGSASHGDYKGDDIKKIQDEYDRMGGLPLSRLPIMYKSNLETDENGQVIPPRLLSSDETAKALYPSLIVNTKGQVREG